MVRKVHGRVGHTGGYDEVCERLVWDLRARAVVLIVVDGRLKEGTGMSVCVDPQKPGALELGMGGGELSKLLRAVADLIDAGVGPNGATKVSYPEQD